MDRYIWTDNDGNVVADSIDFKAFLLWSISNKQSLENYHLEVIEAVLNQE